MDWIRKNKFKNFDIKDYDKLKKEIKKIKPILFFI